MSSISPPGPLKIIQNLCQALTDENVSYCHWKSNDVLDRSASGLNDLDLLINRTHAERFTKILYRLGFKQAEAPKEQRITNILDYYALDTETSRLVHVHAHYQLIVGHDLTKNYRLPIEQAYLDSTAQSHIFKIPDPHFEYITFVVRMILKRSTWDTILIRHGNFSEANLREFKYLQSRVTNSVVSEKLKAHLPTLKTDVFRRCENVLQSKYGFWGRVATGYQLQHALRAYSRRHHLLDAGLKFPRRLSWGIRRKLLNYVPKRKLSSGGAIIAMVGGDGAGKSTVLEESYKLLSEHFDVLRVHLGKPKWSWSTTGIRAILKIGRFLGLYSFTDQSVRYFVKSGATIDFPGYPCLIREVCTARDRYLTANKALRFATNGGLVLCDRFPVSQVKLMDGPVVEQLAVERHDHWAVKLLVDLEEKYYQKIVSPDLLLVLRVNPDIAVKRKTEENETFVRIRSQEIWGIDWASSKATAIDTSPPLAEVLLTVKEKVWSSL